MIANGDCMNHYRVVFGQLFTEQRIMKAYSEYELRLRLEREHPEWFPVQISEILPRLSEFGEEHNGN